MGKPAIRRRAMPVLHINRNIDHIPRMQLLRFLSPFLIKPAPAYTYQNLTASGRGMMDMSVITASRFKGHIENPNLLCGQRRKKALPGKIPLKSVIGLPNRKQHIFLVDFLCTPC